jgi:hypothetical protein
MKKHSSTFEVWTLEIWRLKWGTFTLSCLLAFLIVIPAPAFWLYSVWPIRLRVYPWFKNLDFEGI